MIGWVWQHGRFRGQLPFAQHSPKRPALIPACRLSYLSFSAPFLFPLLLSLLSSLTDACVFCAFVFPNLSVLLTTSLSLLNLFYRTKLSLLGCL